MHRNTIECFAFSLEEVVFDGWKKWFSRLDHVKFCFFVQGGHQCVCWVANILDEYCFLENAVWFRWMISARCHPCTAKDSSESKSDGCFFDQFFHVNFLKWYVVHQTANNVLPIYTTIHVKFVLTNGNYIYKSMTCIILIHLSHYDTKKKGAR